MSAAEISVRDVCEFLREWFKQSRAHDLGPTSRFAHGVSLEMAVNIACDNADRARGVAASDNADELPALRFDSTVARSLNSGEPRNLRAGPPTMDPNRDAKRFYRRIARRSGE